MKIRTSYASIWSISYAIIIAGVSETIIDVTDTIFLARYGMTELAAVGIVDTLYALAIVWALGVVDATQVLVARRAGEDRRQDVGVTFNQSLYLLGALAIFITLALKFAAPFLTAVVIGDEAVRQAADRFLQIIAYSTLFHAFNLAYGVLLLGLARTRILVAATLILAGTNIFLDYCLIFGNLGFFEWGIEGAAIGSLAAEIAAFMFLTVYILYRLPARKYGLFVLQKWNRRLAKTLLRIGLPVSLGALVESGHWFLFFVIIAQLGQEALAWSSILYSCYMVFLIPAEGISEAALSIVSNLIGQDRRTRVNTVLRKAIVLIYLVTSPVLLAAILFPTAVIFVFASDPEAIASCAAGVRVIAMTTLVVIPGAVLFSAVLGTGDTIATLVIEISVATCAIVYTCVAVFYLHLPLEYVWLSEAVGAIVCIITSAVWLHNGRWQRLSW